MGQKSICGNKHAIWIGQYLTQLSDEQLHDAFRAGGFSPQEIEGFSRKVQKKINELVNLQGTASRPQ